MGTVTVTIRRASNIARYAYSAIPAIVFVTVPMTIAGVALARPDLD